MLRGPGKRTRMTLTSDSIDQYRKFIVANGGSQNTARAYGSDLSGFMQWWDGTTPLDEAAPEYLTMVRLDAAPSTVNRKLASLRAYAKWAGIPDPCAHYRPPTVLVGEAHPLPNGMTDVAKLVSTATSYEDKALVILCGYLGCRVAEALAAQWDDLSFRSDGCWLRIRGKGDKTREVPVQPQVISDLATAQALGAGRFVTLPERTARRHITVLGQRAGLGRVISSHDLRMTFGTEVYHASGNDLRAAQELLGHSSSRTTERYTGVSSNRKRQATDFFKEN